MMGKGVEDWERVASPFKDGLFSGLSESKTVGQRSFGSVKDVDLRRQDPEEMIFGAVTM